MGENSMAITWLAMETTWLALGGPLSLHEWSSHLTTIPGKETLFSICKGGHLPKAIIAC